MHSPFKTESPFLEGISKHAPICLPWGCGLDFGFSLNFSTNFPQCPPSRPWSQVEPCCRQPWQCRSRSGCRRSPSKISLFVLSMPKRSRMPFWVFDEELPTKTSRSRIWTVLDFLAWVWANGRIQRVLRSCRGLGKKNRPSKHFRLDGRFALSFGFRPVRSPTSPCPSACGHRPEYRGTPPWGHPHVPGVRSSAGIRD